MPACPWTSRRGERVHPARFDPEPVQTAEPQRNQVQPGSAVQVEPAELPDQPPADTLNLNPDELRRLAQALQLYTQGSGKVKALEQAFDCRKGSSAAYQRASWLFDQTFGFKR